MSSEPARPQVLVVKLSSLGDIMHALPVVTALRRGLDADVDWVTQREYAELVGRCGAVRNVIPVDRQAMLRTWPALRRKLHAQHWDLVVDLHGLAKSALVCLASGGRRRIGPSFHREGARLAYTEVAGTKNLKRHRTEQKLDVITHLGLAPLPIDYGLDFPGRPSGTAAPRVGIIPCSRHADKNWPPAAFAEVAAAAQEEFGAEVVLLGGAEDRATTTSIASGLDPARTQNLAGETGLVELGHTLASLDLCIANDSGPLHYAVAVGTPVIGIYMATDPVVFGPYGPQHRVLQAGLDGAPSVGEVVDAAARILRR